MKDNLPIPEALYPCKNCHEDYSWPSCDLNWCEEEQGWFCECCWEREWDCEVGISLEDEIERRKLDSTRLEAFMRGLDCQNVDYFLATADANDCLALGVSIKKKVEDCARMSLALAHKAILESES